MFCEGQPVQHNLSFGHRFVGFLLRLGDPRGSLGTLWGTRGSPGRRTVGAFRVLMPCSAGRVGLFVARSPPHRLESPILETLVAWRSAGGSIWGELCDPLALEVLKSDVTLYDAM